MRRAAAILALTIPARAFAEPPAERRTPAVSVPALRPACGEHDARLAHVASELVASERRLADADVSERARAVGVETPWPRAVRVRARDDSPRSRASLARALAAFAGAAPARGVRRCGVAVARGPNGELRAAAVIGDALAQWVAPVPERAEEGAWLTLSLRAAPGVVPASLFVAAGDEAPQAIALTRSGDGWSARAKLRSAGVVALQVVGDAGEGPRPLLEARVEAIGETRQAVPDGKASGLAAVDERERSLAVAVHRARWHARLASLAEDRELDALARAHAERMRRDANVAHDLGDGDPEERTSAAGVAVDGVGEDVAVATSLADAYRSLWASPSHRANILAPAWRRLGVGVSRDSDRGRVYVTLLFAR